MSAPSDNNTRQNENHSSELPTPVDVAEEFVTKYYETLFTKQDKIVHLYKEDSVFTSITENVSESMNERIEGKVNIGNALKALNLERYRVRLPVFQAQESVDGCILILAKGRFFKKGTPAEKPFAQTFLLAPDRTGNSWYVKNDILIFLAPDNADQSAGSQASQPTASQTSSQTAQQQAPAQSGATGFLSGVVSAVVSGVQSITGQTPTESSSDSKPASASPASASPAVSQPTASQTSAQTQQSTNAASPQHLAQPATPERRDSPMPTNTRTRPTQNPLSQPQQNTQQSQNQNQSSSSNSGFARPSNKGKEKVDEDEHPQTNTNNNASNTNTNAANTGAAAKPQGKVSYASIVGQASGAQGSGFSPLRPSGQPTIKAPSGTLKVSSIDFKTHEDRVREMFASYGEITALKFNRGFAYIEYRDQESVKKAVAAAKDGEGLILDGRTLILEEKEKTKPTRGIKLDGKRVGMGDEHHRGAGRGGRGGRGGDRGGRGGGDRGGRGGGRGGGDRNDNRENKGDKDDNRENRNDNRDNNNNNNNNNNNRGNDNRGNRNDNNRDNNNNNRGGRGRGDRNDNRGGNRNDNRNENRNNNNNNNNNNNDNRVEGN